MADDITQATGNEWVSFPGGELEGRWPRVRCAACRARRRADGRRADATLCFQCYRATLDRDRALRAAGRVSTASEARFQEQLPFEPIDEARLALLKADRDAGRTADRDVDRMADSKADRTTQRAGTRATLLHGADRFAERRRRAQIAARRALQSIVAARPAHASVAYDRTIAAALHAAELQLPDSWMPFVVAR
jgi:hypothetical protein